MREYLINYARPLIYSTALPLTSLLAIRASLRMVYLADAERQSLKGALRFCFLLPQLVDGCVYCISLCRSWLTGAFIVFPSTPIG
jgi:7-keto-8-aminopelargonate synthetase-like enzyme